MSYEVAIVRLMDGREVAEKPQVFEDFDAALKFVLGTPVSVDVRILTQYRHPL